MSARRLGLALCALALLAGCTQTPPPSEEDVPPAGGPGSAGNVSAVATDLDTPWAVEPAEDGRLFFTERRGRIHVVEDGDATIWRALTSTVERGESGLMGLALHPGFPDEPWVYVCQTHRDGDGDLANRVARVREVRGSGGRVETLLDGIDAGSIHDGCRLGFGPEDRLYVTMGDAAQSSRAQEPSSPNGKVLRMTPGGDPAGVRAGEDGSSWNPYVFTLGHRNPQGLAFHPDTGTAVVSEHGPENHDEVNVLEAGDNYGWPEVRGRDDGDGRFHPAVWSSGADGTVAPAGAAFVDAPDSPLDGAFVFATLKEAQLHVLELGGPGGETVEDEHVVFDERLGRLRAVTWHEDGFYVSTSNRDGRGSPGAHDDRVLRVPLGVIEQAALG